MSVLDKRMALFIEKNMKGKWEPKFWWELAARGDVGKDVRKNIGGRCVLAGKKLWKKKREINYYKKPLG